MSTEDWILLPVVYAFTAVIPFMGLWLIMSIKHMKEMNKATAKSFERGYRSGYEAGLKKGLQLHIMVTSELTDKEEELLTKFLVRHDFMLCYDSDINGFRVRRDGRYNPMDKVIHIVDEHALKVVSDEHTVTFVESKTVPLIQHEIDRLDFEIRNYKIINQNKYKYEKRNKI